jgi:glycosyltransferase involved in cell wall biosynthesis
MNITKRRVVYIKGGRAIEEAERLFTLQGEVPNGGPDQFLLAVIDYLDDAEFRLVSYGQKTEVKIFGDKQAIEYGLRPNNKKLIQRRMAFLMGCIQFFKQTVQYKPSHILCGLDGPFALIAWLVAKISGSKFIFSVHNALNLSSTALYYKFSNAILCKQADAVIVHGPFLKDQAVQLGTQADHLVEFNSSIDEANKVLIEKLKNNQQENLEKSVLFVGRIEEDKGAIDLFKAFIKLDLNHAIKLNYIGEGDALPFLQQLINQHNLQDQVYLHGNLPHAEVFNFLHEATVLVTPSQLRFPEGRCKSAMESFYVGTPVIAPNYGPFPYLVEHEINGLLYETDNINALSAAIQRILSDQDLLKRLRIGAKESGHKLINPGLSFSSAIHLAFEKCLST